MRSTALVLVLLACSKPPKPLPEAILGEWVTWCYTDKDTASCLSKERDGLHHTFAPGGKAEVRRADGGSTSDVHTWALAGTELTLTMSGGGMQLVDVWQARLDEDHLVLWNPRKRIGQVLGRAGASFESGASSVTMGGRKSITLNGTKFSIALPAGYRMMEDTEYRQAWGPSQGDGFVVQLHVSPRAESVGPDGTSTPVPCNDRDYGGVSGSSEQVDGVERETSIGTSICLDGTENSLSCSVEHTRGWLETNERDPALVFCNSIKR